jgi:hypothetical protein
VGKIESDARGVSNRGRGNELAIRAHRGDDDDHTVSRRLVRLLRAPPLGTVEEWRGHSARGVDAVHGCLTVLHVATRAGRVHGREERQEAQHQEHPKPEGKRSN